MSERLLESLRQQSPSPSTLQRLPSLTPGDLLHSEPGCDSEKPSG